VRDQAQQDDLFSAQAAGAVDEAEGSAAATVAEDGEDTSGRRRRRRNPRTRRSGEVGGTGEAGGTGEPAGADDDFAAAGAADETEDDDAEGAYAADSADAAESGAQGRRRRRKRRRGGADGDPLSPDDPPDTVVHVRAPHNLADGVRAIKGSTRLEAKKQRRREGRESGRRRPPVITESEFLARRESVERMMVVRQRGDRTQIAVLEDGVLVEHYVNRTTHASYVGNVYLGKVQNVLPSMEAAFVDIGKGRNAVLYAGEVNFDASGLEGQPKRIESALKAGQSVIVQVTKDPVGHKGARLTSQVSLPGRYLVYVPGASMTGISRKLPDTERTRLKHILKKVTPEQAGVIVRTAAEGAAEAELDRDITRLAAQWENIEKKAKTASAPALLYGEPDLTIRVVRDVFNEDFSKLIVSGDEGWEIIDEYVRYVAPHLADRLTRWKHDGEADADVFAEYRIDEQLAKALDRKVWLPSGGSLVIDRTEAMTVVDVNTGKFTGQGGNLEETVTRNNLEAAEEIVRQLRLRDVGGIVVIDFIDMVLEANRELVLRRLLECLARDRTKHQVAEVTSLGLVQMTRKRVGAGLLEAFSQQCECCNGRGVIITLDTPAEPAHRASAGTAHRPVPAPPGASGTSGSSSTPGNGGGSGNGGGNGKTQGNGGGRNRDTAGGPATGSAVVTEPTPAGPSKPEAAPDGDRAAAADGPQGNGSQGNGDPAAGAAGPSDNGSGRPRTRRSTSAGTAFATAVHVEETPALVPVITTVPAVTEQAPSAPATPGDATSASPDAPPVRRTRSGSAVARVTAAPVLEPVTEETATEETAAQAESPATAEASAWEEAPAPAEVTPLPEDSAAVGPPTSTQVPAPVEGSVPAEPAAPADAPAPADEFASTDAPAPAPAEAEAPVPEAEAEAEPEAAEQTATALSALAEVSTPAEPSAWLGSPAPATEAAPAADSALAEAPERVEDFVAVETSEPVEGSLQVEDWVPADAYAAAEPARIWDAPPAANDPQAPAGDAGTATEALPWTTTPPAEQAGSWAPPQPESNTD
jgi:ribonuclease E